MNDHRLILVPGMGADGRLFTPQREYGLTFEVPELLWPERRETLDRYARRLAEKLDLTRNCTVAGVSFGGMVAYQLASVTPLRKVLLISSCRHPRALRGVYRPVERFSRLLPDAVIRRRLFLSARRIAALERLNPRQYDLVQTMLADLPLTYLRRAGWMAVHWTPPRHVNCPVHAIHGAKDVVIPPDGVDADVLIPDAGHLISLTHAQQVNEFIQSHLHIPAPTASESTG